ncbi:MAG: response regulator [Omnitrophica bacterium]|nr:response regulator [Candidatus Omnitrophota bacterium]
MAKILIIDDDPDLIESMRVVLESKGYEVISAESGEEGLEKQKKQKPDLIVLDVMMPKMDGFETARAIKKTGNNTPVLMLTAIKDKMGLDFKNSAGDPDWLPVDDYCEKPLDKGSLIAKIEKLLSSS